jgi:hypothetical protein
MCRHCCDGGLKGYLPVGISHNFSEQVSPSNTMGNALYRDITLVTAVPMRISCIKQIESWEKLELIS